MISVEKTNRVSADILCDLTPHSRGEYMRARQDELEKSASAIYVIRDDNIPLVCVGVQHHGLLAYSDLWFLVCLGFSKQYALRARQFVRQILLPQSLGYYTFIETGYVAGERFAAFIGFQKTKTQMGNFSLYEVSLNG